jgi:hypothetical protein
MYRLLGQGDVITQGDQFIDDNCETWTDVKEGTAHGFLIGHAFHRNLKPFRRLTSDNNTLEKNIMNISDDTHRCKGFGKDDWFKVVAKSRQNSMLIVEHVGNGGNVHVMYKHAEDFTLKPVNAK